MHGQPAEIQAYFPWVSLARSVLTGLLVTLPQGSAAPATAHCLPRSVPLDEVEILATFDEADFRPEEVDAPPPTVVVIESEDVLLELFRRLLEQRGYRVVSAADVREGAEVMRRYDADLALVGIRAPSSRELRNVSRIRREAGEQCPVVVVCKSAGTRRVRRGYEAGADYVITQPFRPETIRNIAALLLDDAPGVAPTAAVAQ